MPAPPINLLPPRINICSGQEEEEEAEEECLEECQHHYFSTSMSSVTKFEDPGDFFYSTLLRRPGPASPVDSPKFWAEYVQYVKSLGNSTVLGPPRCHISFQFEKKLVSLGKLTEQKTHFLFRRDLLGPSCLEQTVRRKSNQSLANLIQKDQPLSFNR